MVAKRQAELSQRRESRIEVLMHYNLVVLVLRNTKMFVMKYYYVILCMYISFFCGNLFYIAATFI